MVAVGIDVAASDLVIREGFETRFVAATLWLDTVVSSVGHYWRQHLAGGREVFWELGQGGGPHSGAPCRSGSRAGRLLSVTATGSCSWWQVAGAALAVVPLWVPVVYLAVPGTEILLAC